MAESMTLRISKKTGEMQLSIDGVSGPVCNTKLGPVAAKMGVVLSEEPTPAMYEQPEAEVITQES